MAINKVVYNTEEGAQVLIDLTDDTVTPEALEEGVTAHAANGEMIVGVATPVSVHNVDPLAHPDIREKIEEILLLLDIDYNNLLFDTEEIIIDITYKTTSVLGKAILGQMILV